MRTQVISKDNLISGLRRKEEARILRIFASGMRMFSEASFAPIILKDTRLSSIAGTVSKCSLTVYFDRGKFMSGGKSGGGDVGGNIFRRGEASVSPVGMRMKGKEKGTVDV